jgi:Xaa-Pro aminopeptidase
MVSNPRLSKLIASIPQQTAWLLSQPNDIRYFSDFGFLVPTEREALLFVSANHVGLIHATFSPVTGEPGISYYEGCHVTRLTTHLEAIREQSQFSNLLIDADTLFVSEYQILKKIKGLRIANLDHQLIWQFRMIKDEREQELMRQAGQITHQAFQALRPQLKAGMTEIDVKDLLEAKLHQLGSPSTAFPTIVAFGEHSALPHHQPTNKPLETEMSILIDFGATSDGYCADMTRTIWFGKKPAASFLEIESIVKAAYQAVIERMEMKNEDGDGERDGSLQKNGSVKGGDVERRGGRRQLQAKHLDYAARSLITKRGFGHEFIHTTGHGLGLDIHEQPSLNWKNTDPILPGMTLTVEPGIYLEGEFGYRYENTILITEDGGERLS